MVEKLIDELSALPEVEAIALGGSRAGTVYDEKSDYDIYVYCSCVIKEETRLNILKKYCSYMEIGNHFWEYEDNCTLSIGVDIDILWRNLDEFVQGVSEVVDNYRPSNCYTTCMWHNLITSQIIYDRNGRLTEAQNRYRCEYPEELKNNIINRNMKLLTGTLPAFDAQIAKAAKRGDRVSVNHRVTEFLAAYFDIIFAINKKTHPGEKRLMELCEKECKILPADFNDNLVKLFDDMGNDYSKVPEDIEVIVKEITSII
jgi:hypothetical protein